MSTMVEQIATVESLASKIDHMVSHVAFKYEHIPNPSPEAAIAVSPVGLMVEHTLQDENLMRVIRKTYSQDYRELGFALAPLSVHTSSFGGKFGLPEDTDTRLNIHGTLMTNQLNCIALEIDLKKSLLQDSKMVQRSAVMVLLWLARAGYMGAVSHAMTRTYNALNVSGRVWVVQQVFWLHLIESLHDALDDTIAGDGTPWSWTEPLVLQHFMQHVTNSSKLERLHLFVQKAMI